nr:Kiwa anti-phage protein KwaB-like domain-containing protein [uncultured Treponema sp.]
MTQEEVKKWIHSILIDVNFGIDLFTVLKNNENFETRKMLINPKLYELIKQKILSFSKKDILSEDFELDIAKNIATSRNIFYEIIQSNSYRPFSFININLEKVKNYTEKEKLRLTGFLIRIHRNNNLFWIYQHKYPTTLIKRDSSLFAILNGNVYEPLERDIVKFEDKADIYIINNSIITKKINIMQNIFGFEEYIRIEASKTVDQIRSVDIVSDLSQLINLLNKPKLTVAKKLMKAKDSPVTKIPKEILLTRIKTHDYYSKKIFIDKDNKKIVIKSQVQAKEFLKMLNDDILFSKLTENDYTSIDKEILKN